MRSSIGIKLALVGLGLATLLAGCGGNNPAAKSTDDGRALQLGNGATSQNGQQDQNLVPQILSEVAAARPRVNTISTSLVGYFVDEKTGKSGSNKVKYCWQRPNKTSVSILESSTPETVGTKLVWTGGSKMAVHTKFIGFWLDTDVEIHDSRATDQRGFFIDETSVDRMMDTFLEPTNQTRILGIGPWQSYQVVAQMEIRSSKSLRNISREVFYIDGQRKLPVAREMYDRSDKLVFRLQFNDLQINQTLPANTFTLK